MVRFCVLLFCVCSVTSVFGLLCFLILFVFCSPVIRPQKGANNLQKQNRAGPKLIHFKKFKRGPG
jgi:lipopolysaccharide/colanic/teichoic acid biosynthesis glycosyltransferase